jgi:hypothetical protein
VVRSDFLRANRTGSGEFKMDKKPESSLRGVILDYASGTTYFSMEGLRRFLAENHIDYKPNSLKQSLYRLRKESMIFSAGRGWYSTISKQYRLDKKPVNSLRVSIAEQFPLLSFSLWSTAQVKEFYHHLPSRFWTFIYTDADFLEPLGDFLVEKNHNLLVNPAGGGAVKYSSFKKGDFTVLRPEIKYRGKEGEYFKSIEKIMVDLFQERQKIDFLDLQEYEKVLSNLLTGYRINLAKLMDYAHNRKAKPAIGELISNVIDNGKSDKK